MRLLPITASFAAVALVSCSGASLPVAPAPSSSAAPAPASPTLVTAHLRGRVLEEGAVPVTGAAVKTSGAPGGFAITDGSGAFDIAVTIDTRSRPLGFVFVNIDKSGYEPSIAGASFESFGAPAGLADVSKDYRLYRTRTITAGSAARLAIEPDDPWCGFEAEWTCRVVRIRAPQAGTLIVEAIPDDAASHFGLVLSNNYRYPFTLTPRLSVPTSAGQVTSVDLLHAFAWANGRPIGSSQPVTLTTSLLPE